MFFFGKFIWWGFSSRRFVSEFTGGQLDPAKLGAIQKRIFHVIESPSFLASTFVSHFRRRFSGKFLLSLASIMKHVMSPTESNSTQHIYCAHQIQSTYVFQLWVHVSCTFRCVGKVSHIANRNFWGMASWHRWHHDLPKPESISWFSKIPSASSAWSFGGKADHHFFHPPGGDVLKTLVKTRHGTGNVPYPL